MRVATNQAAPAAPYQFDANPRAIKKKYRQEPSRE